MLLLSYWIVILFLICVNFTQTHNLISWIFFSDGLDLAFIHMINDDNFFFWKIHCHFCDLLFCEFKRIFLKLTGHFKDADLSNMIIIIKRIFGCIHFVFLSFDKSNTLWNQSIIPIRIQFDSFLSNFFNSFN